MDLPRRVEMPAVAQRNYAASAALVLDFHEGGYVYELRVYRRDRGYRVLEVWSVRRVLKLLDMPLGEWG